MNGLGDVPGTPARRRARRRRRAARHAVPVEPAAAARAPLGVRRPAADEPARAVLAPRAVRAALPDSPLELAVAARYLGIGDPFALARDELASAREVVAPAQSAAAPLLRCRRAALALPARRDRSCARATPRRSAISARASSRACPSEGTIATERVLGVVAGHAARRLRAARRRRVARARRAGAARRRARAAARAHGDLRRALRGRLQDAPACALADAREQRRGDPSGRRGGCHGLAGMGRRVGAPAGVSSRRNAARSAVWRCRPAGGIARVHPMFAARGNVRVLDRARRVGRHVSVLAALCGGHRRWLGYACPGGQDGRYEGRGEPGLGADPGRRRAPRGVDRAVQRRQVPPQADDGRIHENEVRLSTARVNLKNARHALNISIISAYKNPQPDPLQAALEARNFGQVLEQFALLDRAKSYNASILTRHPRLPKAGRLEPARAQPRAQHPARDRRRAAVAEGRRSRARSPPTSSATAAWSEGAPPDPGAPRGRERGLAARRRAAAPAAGRVRRTAAVAVDIGGVSARTRRSGRSGVSTALRRPPRRARRQSTSRSASSARRMSGAAPRPAASTARASSPGPTPRRARRPAALHGRALELGHAHLRRATGAGRPRLLQRPQPRRHVHRRRQLRARAAHRRRRQDLEISSYSGYVGAVRVSG